MTRVKKNILEKFYQAWEINPQDPNNNLCFYYIFPDKLGLAQLITRIEDEININPQLQNCFRRDALGQITGLKSNKTFAVNHQLVNSTEIERSIQKLSKFVPDISSDLLIKVDCIEATDQNLFVVFFNIHHILLDGKGLESFISSLNEAIPTNKSENCVIMPAKLPSDIAESNAYFQQLESIAGEYEYTAHNSPEIFSDNAYLPQELHTRLTLFAADNQLSLFNVLLIAYAIFETQLCNRSSTLVLYPIDRRLTPGGLGCAVNSVVLPFGANPDETFRDCLNNHHQNLGILKDIASIDLLDILEYTNLSPSVTSFAESIMAQLPALNGAVATALPQLSSSPYGVKYSILNQLVYFRFDCYKDVFTDTIKKSFLARFFKFIDKLITQPQKKLQEFSLLMDQDEQQQLYSFNKTGRDYPRDATIVGLFENVVAKYPENIAVSAANGQLTYRELNHRAEQLAGYLISQGVKNDDLLGILIDNRLEMIIALVAVIKAGAAYVPMADDTPLERVSYILEDSQARFLLTLPQLVTGINTDAQLIDIADQSLSAKYCRPAAKSSDLIYAIYTSGTTGKPKGTLLEHGTIVNLIRYFQQRFEINNNSHCSKYAGFGFDASSIEIFPALLCGATLHVIPDHQKTDLDAVRSFFIKNRITNGFLPTQFAELFLESEIPDLKYLIAAGEKLNQFKLANFMLVNGYGPTEASVHTTDFIVDKNYKNIPIGKPINNVKCYVVNQHLTLLPVGLVGELLIGGECLARGYLNQPELTAEKFIANPFQTEEEKQRGYNDRVYKTGDLVRWLPDGNLEYIGRNDFQVKIRGYRIELGEIENRLRAITGIEQVQVLALDDTSQNKFLCGYYTGRQYCDQELAEILGKQLASYMVPDYFIWLDTFPLTINGKVDRRALPAPDLSKSSSEYLAPRNEEEQLICEEFASVLGLEAVGINDDFYRLGGNSIKTIKLVSKLQTNFKVNVADVFKLKTPASLALLPRLISDLKIMKNPPREYYPLIAAQERVFLANQIDNNSILYNIPLRIIIRGALDRERLGSALNSLSERHIILKNRIFIENGYVVQAPDNREISKEFQTATFGEVDKLFSDFVVPFELTRDSLMRVKLVKINSIYHELFIDAHHVIFDGGSVNIFISELMELYSGSELLALPISYYDYAIWLNEGKGKGFVATHENYWRQQFAGFEVEALTLPLDYQRPLVAVATGGNVSLKLSPELYQRLNLLISKLNISLYSVNLFAINLLLHLYTGQDNIIIGTAINGRTVNETENLLGMFVSTLPIVSKFDNQLNIGEMLLSTHDNAIQLISNQGYPLNAIIEHLGLLSQGQRNPLFDVVYNYLESFEATYEKDGISWQLDQSLEDKVAKFDLTFTCINSNDGLVINLNYATCLFKHATIERLADHFVTILELLANENTLATNIGSVDILSLSEKQQLYSFNDTGRDYPRDATIVDLFENIVAKYPRNVAVVSNGAELTYDELLTESQNCAAHLQASGVSPGDFVALLSSRSTDYYIMVLAVLYAGAAFIPLDISYPPERILGILEDSNAYLLTNGSDYPDVSKRILINTKSNEKIHYSKVITSSELPACLIYTSGSTGKPKGAILTQRNIINFCYWYVKERSLVAEDRYAEYASFGFDAGAIMGTFPPLLCGASIYLIPEDMKLNLNAIKDFILDNKIVGCFFTTLIAEQFIESFELPGVRFIECGGEKFKKYLPRNFDFYNGYGPTECTVYSTQYLVSKESSNIPIGSPLANYSCQVVNKYLQLVPVGIVGELLIGGDGVGLGYLNQPELTAEKFIANPFQTEEEKQRGYNDRVYKTGDLVRWLPDGNLEYIGRNDFQVKIRGYRIELGEIENQLQLIPGVEDVYVIASKDANGSSFLCAYYTGRQYCDQELAEILGKQLASYMIPDYFVCLAAFPLTVNGKVDRNALPFPDLSKLTSEYFAPQSEEEQLICEEFAKVLGVEQVGVNDDFYRLGGNSIKTIWLVSKLQTNFKINVADVFKYKTPAVLAKNISFVKDNLKQKLDLIKDYYACGGETIPLSEDQQYRQQTYAAQVAKVNSSTSNYQMKPIRQVLLTGATGYLGCNLLYQLLNTTDYRVVALVRAKSDIDAWQRVQTKYQFYFDSDLSIYADRLSMYAADLEASDLALTPEIYRHLQTETDSILHSAALVKHYGEYDEFYQANVQATINLLELAKNSRGKDFHYVSTYSVLQDGYIPGYADYFCDESVDGSIFVERSNVYVQTKYEGEALARDYRQFGVSSSIYRVGNLSIISFNGRNQENIEDNGFFARVKAMLNIGAISSETATVEMSPVDITALGIVKLFDKQELSNQTHHVYSPHLVDLSLLFAQDSSLLITKLSINAFIDNLLSKLNLSTYQEQIKMFMLHQGWLEESKDNQQTLVQLAQDLTTAILTNLGVEWPQISLPLVNDIVHKSYQERIKFLAENFTNQDIHENILLELAKVSQLSHYDSGDIIVDQWQNDAKIKIIMNGFVDNYIKSSGGWISSLQLNSGGDIANLEALIHEESSSAYEAVFGSVTTLEISSDNFSRLAARYPQLNCNILNKVLADKAVLQQMYACLK